MLIMIQLKYLNIKIIILLIYRKSILKTAINNVNGIRKSQKIIQIERHKIFHIKKIYFRSSQKTNKSSTIFYVQQNDL